MYLQKGDKNFVNFNQKNRDQSCDHKKPGGTRVLQKEFVTSENISHEPNGSYKVVMVGITGD